MSRLPHFLRFPAPGAVALLAAVFMFFRPSAAATITNGNFEGGFTGGLANGWTLFSTGGYNPIPVDETTIVHGGAHAQRVRMPQPASGEAYGGIYQIVATTPNTLYQVGLWMYTIMPGETYSGEDLVCSTGFDTQGRTNWNTADWELSWLSLPSSPRNAWIYIKREFLAASSTTTIFLKGWRKWPQHGEGSFILDDVTITEVVRPSPPSHASVPAPTPPDTTGSNLLTNPDFEGGFAAGVGTGWQSWTARGSGYWQASADLGKIGPGNYDNGPAHLDVDENMIAMHSKVGLFMDCSMGAVHDVKPHVPTMLAVGRVHIDDVNFWDCDDDTTIALGREHAELCQTWQNNNQPIDAWQGYNEPWVQSRERARKTALFEQAFAERCTELGLRSVVLNLAVGSFPTDNDCMEYFKDALAVADFAGYHAYGGSSDQLLCGPQRNDFALRWRYVASFYEQQGWRMPGTIYTESGTYFGWHGSFSDTEIRDDYVNFGNYMQEDEWCLGNTIFTVGGFGLWEEWCINEYPTIINGIGAWNAANPCESRGGKAQQFGHNGSNLRGGIRQVVTTTPGAHYWLTGWFKYEVGRGGSPVNPAAKFYIGYDPTGQTANPSAGTIVWSADQISTRYLNSDIWYEFGVEVAATGNSTSIWLAGDQITTSPTYRITVDSLSMKQTGGVTATSPPGALQSPGWNLISIPLSPVDPACSSVFSGVPNLSGNLYRYDHGLSTYQVYPGDFTTANNTDGYWLYLTSAATISYEGYANTTAQTIDLLTPGWYLIGVPSQTAVALTNLTVTNLGAGGSASLVQAARDADKRWLSLPLYWYDPAADGYTTCGPDPWHADDYCRPWRGYWLLTHVPDLRLTVPAE